MINELYGLSQALKENNIASASWHRKYKVLPKVTKNAPCFRICISETGINEITPVSAELALNLRKYGSNQGTFPAMNLMPLFRITDEVQKKQLEQMKRVPTELDLAKVRSWCTENNWNKKFISKLKNSLYRVSRELKDLTEGHSVPEHHELLRLMTLICQQFPEEKLRETLHAALEEAVIQNLTIGEQIPLMLSMLIHSGTESKNADNDCGTLSVIWDIENWRDYGYPIASEHFTKCLNQMLLDADENKRATIETDAIDAYGISFALSNEPMPSVMLAGGFESTIYTMFEGQPCQNRYGNFDRKVTSYPLAPENRTALKQALEWIADSDQEGKTWLKMSKDEILFVYPSRLLNVPMKYASLLGKKKENPASHEARFTAEAKAFIEGIRGIPTDKRPEHIHIFALRKVDKARTKVLFTRIATPEFLIKAAEDWQKGCTNLPEFDFARNEQVHMPVPFPIECAGIMNQVWRTSQGKPASAAIKRFDNYYGVELLLNEHSESERKYQISMFLRNYSALVLWYGMNMNSGRWKETEKQAPSLLKALPLLGLMLNQSHIHKEDYMESYPYLLGQMLKISDKIHVLYCKIVREDQVAPQLAGSSMYNTAAETPIAALAQLASRMAPYLTWASSYSQTNKEKSGLVRWHLRQYEQVTAKMELCISDKKRFDDYEKAQLFLGYLAALPELNKENTTECIDEKEKLL